MAPCHLTWYTSTDDCGQLWALVSSEYELRWDSAGPCWEFPAPNTQLLDGGNLALAPR